MQTSVGAGICEEPLAKTDPAWLAINKARDGRVVKHDHVSVVFKFKFNIVFHVQSCNKGYRQVHVPYKFVFPCTYHIRTACYLCSSSFSSSPTPSGSDHLASRSIYSVLTWVNESILGIRMHSVIKVCVLLIIPEI